MDPNSLNYQTLAHAAALLLKGLRLTGDRQKTYRSIAMDHIARGYYNSACKDVNAIASDMNTDNALDKAVVICDLLEMAGTIRLTRKAST